MLQKVNAQVSSYTPFRFRPPQGSEGQALNIVAESEDDEESGPIMKPLIQEVCM